MNTIRTALVCGLAASLLSACGSTTYPSTTYTTVTTVHEATYGVVESVQLVQVVPPPGGAAAVAPDGSPVHPAYQIGVRLAQGGYQIFTQDNGWELRVGDQVRIDNGRVHRAS